MYASMSSIVHTEFVPTMHARTSVACITVHLFAHTHTECAVETFKYFLTRMHDTACHAGETRIGYCAVRCIQLYSILSVHANICTYMHTFQYTHMFGVSASTTTLRVVAHHCVKRRSVQSSLTQCQPVPTIFSTAAVLVIKLS